MSHGEDNPISLECFMKGTKRGESMNSDKKPFHNVYDVYYPAFIFFARNAGPEGEMRNKC